MKVERNADNYSFGIDDTFWGLPFAFVYIPGGVVSIRFLCFFIRYYFPLDKESKNHD